MLNTISVHVALMLQSALRASFARVPLQTDYFMVDPATATALTPVLKLSRGFLSADPVLTPYSNVADMLAKTGASTSALTTRTDNTLGAVKIFSYASTSYCVSAEYTSGFVSAADSEDSQMDNPSPIYLGVPEWLSSVAIVAIMDMYKAMKLWNTDMKKSKDSKLVSALQQYGLPPSVLLSINPYIRYVPSGILPL
jgi:hypothetical protein